MLKRLELTRELLRELWVLCTHIIYEIELYVPEWSYPDDHRSLKMLFHENREHTKRHLDQIEKAIHSLRKHSGQKARKVKRVINSSHKWLAKELLSGQIRITGGSCLLGDKFRECMLTRHFSERDIQPWERDAEEIRVRI